MMLFRTKLADSMGPLLLGLLPLLWTIRAQKAGRALLFLLAAAWLPLAAVVLLPRYYLAAAAFLAMGLGWALSEAGARMKAAVLASCLLCFCVYRGHAVPRQHWRAFTGEVSFKDYLSHASEPYYHSPLFPAADALSGLRGGRVLVYGDARGFYLERPFIAASPFQPSPLERWAEASKSGKELRGRLEEAGVAYLAVNHAEIVRLQKPLSFSAKAKRALDELFASELARDFRLGPDYARLPGGTETLDRWVEVYRLLPPEEAALTHPPLSLFDGYSIR